MMGGRFSRAAMGAAVALSLVGTPARADQRLAFSENLGIDVVAKGAPWCGPQISLELKLRQGSQFLARPDDLSNFLSRLKTPIESDCPAAQSLTATATGPNGAEIAGGGRFNATKAGGWAGTRLASAPAAPVPPHAPAPVRSAATPPSTSAAPTPIATPQRAVPPAPAAAATATATPPGRARGAAPTIADAKTGGIPRSAMLAMAVATDPNLRLTPEFEKAALDVYACEEKRRARDEFQKQEAATTAKTRLDSHVKDLQAAIDDKKVFYFWYTWDLGPYDFNAGGFSGFGPFGTLSPIRASQLSDCAEREYTGFPTSFVFSFPNFSEYLKTLKVAKEEARALFPEREARRLGVIAAVHITGFRNAGNTGALELKPIALRVVRQSDERDIMVLNEDAFAAMIADADALKQREREEAERTARMAREAEIRTGLENRKDRVARFAMLNDAGGIYSPYIGAGQAIAMQSEVDVVMIFKAGESGTAKIPAAWPERVTLTLDREANVKSLEKGQWYFAAAKASPKRPPAEDNIIQAELTVTYAYACREDECAEADNVNELMETWSKGGFDMVGSGTP